MRTRPDHSAVPAQTARKQLGRQADRRLIGYSSAAFRPSALMIRAAAIDPASETNAMIVSSVAGPPEALPDRVRSPVASAGMNPPISPARFAARARPLYRSLAGNSWENMAPMGPYAMVARPSVAT